MLQALTDSLRERYRNSIGQNGIQEIICETLCGDMNGLPCGRRVDFPASLGECVEVVSSRIL